MSLTIPSSARPIRAKAAASPPVDILTFNTAGDGCRNTPEGQIPLSAPFQKVVKGAPDASIIGMQESTPALLDALSKDSQNGNFKLVSWGPNWIPSFLRLLTIVPDTSVMVPKRYQIQSVQWVGFKGRLGLFFDAAKNFLFHHGPALDLANALTPSGFCELKLRDKITGKSFTLINSHVSGSTLVRDAQEPQMIAKIKQAQAQGPVVVIGDFNTASEATNFSHNPDITHFWNVMKSTNLVDNGATDKTSGGQCIDHILTSGFVSVKDVVYDGDKLTIPGRSDASQVSDHYAHGESLQFAS